MARVGKETTLQRQLNLSECSASLKKYVSQCECLCCVVCSVLSFDLCRVLTFSLSVSFAGVICII